MVFCRCKALLRGSLFLNARISAMLKVLKLCFMPLALLIFISSASPSFSQLSGPDMDPTLFESASPLTEQEVKNVIELLPRIHQKDLTVETFNALAEEKNMTPERLNFAVVKTTLGLMIALKPESRAEAAKIAKTEKALPTDAELEVIKLHIDELTAVFSK
jgi:hypothetical protein